MYNFNVCIDLSQTTNAIVSVLYKLFRRNEHLYASEFTVYGNKLAYDSDTG